MIPPQFLRLRYRGRIFLVPESPIGHFKALFGHEGGRLVTGFPSVDALRNVLFHSTPDVAPSSLEEIDLDVIEQWTADEHVQEVDLIALDNFNSFMAEVLSLLPDDAAKRAHGVIKPSLDASAPLRSRIDDAKLAYYLAEGRDEQAAEGNDQEGEMSRAYRRPLPFWGEPPEKFADVMKDDRMRNHIGKLIGLFGELVDS